MGCSKRSRRIARRCACNRAHAQSSGDGLAHDRNEHRHTEVFERAGVAIAAHLHPEIVAAELAAIALRPEKVGAPLIHRNDEVIGHVGDHPLTLAPNTRSVRPERALVAVVEELHPGVRAARTQRLDVVDDLEKTSTPRTSVNGLSQRKGAVTPEEAAELGVVIHGTRRQCSVLALPHDGDRRRSSCRRSHTSLLAMSSRGGTGDPWPAAAANHSLLL